MYPSLNPLEVQRMYSLSERPAELPSVFVILASFNDALSAAIANSSKNEVFFNSSVLLSKISKFLILELSANSNFWAIMS